LEQGVVGLEAAALEHLGAVGLVLELEEELHRLVRADVDVAVAEAELLRTARSTDLASIFRLP
jgi:hypothetical protein